MQSVELFAGAGGLALGCHLAGFTPALVAEWDRWACDTIRENQTAGYPLVEGWNVYEGDVRSIDWTQIEGPTDLVAGGPPCQPFSLGGKHGAAADPRDMFPATAEVLRALQPRAFIVENVKGLTRAAFAEYYKYIQLRLALPELTLREGETLKQHAQRLNRHTGRDTLHYTVVPTVVNAADFGVPQQRHRVIMVGYRDDVAAEWVFPPATHSKDALLHAQWVSGEYWAEHEVPTRDRPEPPSPATVTRLADNPPQLHRWRTVRDALAGLPEPTPGGSRQHLNHILQPGARTYPGHTGSPIDWPAKTLKAGGHGVPGGENMLRRADGTVRYFTVRESARLQTFPDRYELHGAWGEAMRQLGNAVPVLLAQTVAGAVAEQLAVADVWDAAQRRRSA